VKGGKWHPKSKFCTASSSSRQPPTRANCSPLIEDNSSNTNDLGAQNELILANLKLFHDEQQEERAEKEDTM